MIPSASDLKYFIEIAQTQNLSRAAERLGLSQPSLTLAMQRLEGEVGAKVFERSKRGVLLTQAGKQLLVHAKHLLQAWDQVRVQALASIDQVQGSYTLGCHPSVALYTLSGFLGPLLEEHPALNITLKHDLSRKIAEGVISSSIDVGIAVNPIRHPDLIIRKVCDDEITLWSQGDTKRDCQDIRSGKAVLICDPELMQSQSILKQLKKARIEIGRFLPSSSLEVIADLAAHGCGIGVLPTRVVEKSHSEVLKRVPRAPVFLDEVCSLIRVENRGVKSIQAILNGIQSALV